MKVVITGGNGALGRRITGDLISAGHVAILIRQPRPGRSARQLLWDGCRPGPCSGS